MKKLASLLALVLLLAGATPALAGDDRPIAYEKLPATARQFITAHFADTRLSYAKVDSEWWDTTYEERDIPPEQRKDRRTCEVKLDGGLDLTFDRDYRLIGIDD